MLQEQKQIVLNAIEEAIADMQQKCGDGDLPYIMGMIELAYKLNILSMNERAAISDNATKLYTKLRKERIAKEKAEAAAKREAYRKACEEKKRELGLIK